MAQRNPPPRKQTKGRLARKLARRRIPTITWSSNADSIIYRYRQYCDSALLSYTGVTSTTITDSCYAWQFQLNMIPQVATFTSLYDEYRIDGVEFTLVPRANINIASGNLAGTGQNTVANAYLPRLIIAKDHDDATVPASYNALREYGNSKEYYVQNGRVIKVYIKPAVAQQIYNGVTSANSERFSPWIDCANNNVPHYGIKVALPASAIANYITLDVTVRYLLSFRQVR